MIRAGVVGSGGYAAGELIRLLLNHPAATLVWAQSQSQAGKPLWAVHDDLQGETSLLFCSEADLDTVDLVFLCGGHGQSAHWMEAHRPSDRLLIIDLSHDYRLDETFTYGLTDDRRMPVAARSRIANPGCFATAIQLALLPLAASGALRDTVHIQATTGSTGAGQALQDSLHFSWRQNNLSVYKPFQHQHLAEIRHNLSFSQQHLPELVFIPQRGSFTRGIFTSLYTHSDQDLPALQSLYSDYYADSPFVKIAASNPHLKQVVNTNNALIYLQKFGERIFVICVIDNLLKGAAGQAIENMNIAFGLDRKEGLRLKAAAF